MGKPENELQRACLEYLKFRGIMAWRNNTGAAVAEYKGKKRFWRYGHPGSGDILGAIPPNARLLSVETKVRTTLSPDQRAWRDEVLAVGGVAIVAQSVEDVEDGLEEALNV